MEHKRSASPRARRASTIPGGVTIPGSIGPHGHRYLRALAEQLAEHTVVELSRQLHEAQALGWRQALEDRGDGLKREAAEEKILLLEGEPPVKVHGARRVHELKDD